MKQEHGSLAAPAGATAMALPGIARDAWVSVRNVGLGACLDAAPGAGTAVRECDGSRSQRWRLEIVDAGKGHFRLRKNDRECAELVPEDSGALLALHPCDAGAPGQVFRARQAGWDVGSVYLYSVGQRRVVTAAEIGATPFTSGSSRVPAAHGIWSFRPAPGAGAESVGGS